MQRGYQAFQALLSGPDGSVGRIKTIKIHAKAVEWLNSQPAYQAWLEDKESSVLAITGPGGSGSSHLAYHILQLLQATNTDPGAMFLSFNFYCLDRRATSERSMVISLIRQVLTLWPESYQLLGKSTEVLSHQSLASYAPLWVFFRSLLATRGACPVFLVINAIDQCRESIAATVGRLTTDASIKSRLKILVTSIVPVEMPAEVPFRNLSLHDACWRQNLRCIAVEGVARLVHKRPVWKDLEDTIIDRLCSGNVTFLGVSLSLGVLEQRRMPSTREAARHELDTIFPGPAFSVRDVFAIIAQGPASSRQARLALNWVAHAIRPLSVRELAVAVALGDSAAGHEQTFEALVETVSWDIMGDLSHELGMAVKVVDNQVLLVHHTFHDFATRHPDLILPDFHAFAAKQCLAYIHMCSEYEPKVSMERDSLRYPQVGIASAFLEYAELYWPEHYRQQQPTSEALLEALDESVRQFLTPRDSHPDTVEEEAEQPHVDTLLSVSSPVGEGKDFAAPVTPDQAAAAAGMDDADLLDAVSNPGTVGPAESTRSDAAKGFRSLETWIKKYVRAFGWKEDTSSEPDPLLLAIRLGLTSSAQRIMGADVKQDKERLSRATVMAARMGNVGILDELTRALPVDTLGPALVAAAKHGQVDALNLLAERAGPDVLQALRASNGDENPLLVAAANGHTAVVDALLAVHGFDMHATDDHGNTPVHHAARLGDAHTLQAMIKSASTELAAAVRTPNDAHMLPLHVACRAGWSVEAFEIIFKETPPELRLGSESLRTLQVAAEAGHLYVVERLIGAGANVADDRNRSTPLDLAARHGHFDVVRRLVEELEKIYPTAPTPATPTTSQQPSTPISPVATRARSGSTAAGGARGGHGPRSAISDGNASFWRRTLNCCLPGAIKNGHTQVVDFLVRRVHHGLEQDCEYMMWAVEAGNLDMIRVLVRAGISVQQDRYLDLLGLAVERNYVDVLRYLVDTGSAASWPERPTELLLNAARHNQHNCIRELLRRAQPDDLQRRDYRGRTAIEVAAACGSTDALRVLLAWADAQHAAAAGGGTVERRRSPRVLIYAIRGQKRGSNSDIVRLLLDNGWPADYERRSERSGSSASGSNQEIPLHAAARRDDGPVVSLLLDRGAVADARNPRTDETALHVAARCGANRAIAALLDHARGADPNLVDCQGLSPLHIAVMEGHTRTVSALLQHGSPPTAPQQEDTTRSEDDDDASSSSSGTTADTDSDDVATSRPPVRRVNVELETPDGRRALHLAHASVEITRDLLKHVPTPEVDARVNRTLETALLLAARQGPSGVVAALLQAGADANTTDAAGRSALYHVAARLGKRSSKNYENDGDDRYDEDEEDSSEDETDRANKGAVCEEIMRLLLASGADVNLVGGALHSPLQALAASSTSRRVSSSKLETGDGKSAVAVRLATLLLDAGAHATAVGGAFGSPVHAAAWQGNVELVRLLLERSGEGGSKGTRASLAAAARLDVMPFGTPLHAMLFVPSRPLPPVGEIASLLVASSSADGGAAKSGNAIINARGRCRGLTPLLLAVRGLLPEAAVQALLDLGASVRARDDARWTALHHAASVAMPGMVRLLLAAAAAEKRKEGASGGAADEENAATDRDGCGRGVLYLAVKSWLDHGGGGRHAGDAGDDDENSSGGVGSDEDSDGMESTGTGRRSSVNGPGSVARMQVFRNVLAHMATRTQRLSHLAESLPAAVKSQNRLAFDAIMAAEGGSVNVNVPDRSGWTALDIASCYGMAREVAALQARGAVRGVEHMEPTEWSLYDRELDIKLADDGLTASMTGTTTYMARAFAASET